MGWGEGVAPATCTDTRNPAPCLHPRSPKSHRQAFTCPGPSPGASSWPPAQCAPGPFLPPPAGAWGGVAYWTRWAARTPNQALPRGGYDVMKLDLQVRSCGLVSVRHFSGAGALCSHSRPCPHPLPPSPGAPSAFPPPGRLCMSAVHRCPSPSPSAVRSSDPPPGSPSVRPLRASSPCDQDGGGGGASA